MNRIFLLDFGNILWMLDTPKTHHKTTQLGSFDAYIDNEHLRNLGMFPDHPILNNFSYFGSAAVLLPTEEN
jgi:hypothetical protein